MRTTLIRVQPNYLVTVDNSLWRKKKASIVPPHRRAHISMQGVTSFFTVIELFCPMITRLLVEHSSALTSCCSFIPLLFLHLLIPYLNLYSILLCSSFRTPFHPAWLSCWFLFNSPDDVSVRRSLNLWLLAGSANPLAETRADIRSRN